ncbi:MAG: DUF4345 family protein [Alphaproteobacteria bacterium]
MVFGSNILVDNVGPSFDSHVRYLSGLLFAMGIGFWAAIPAIETQAPHIRLLTSLVVVGGLARLAAAIFIAPPSQLTLFALGSWL